MVLSPWESNAMPHLLTQRLQRCSGLQPVLDRALSRAFELTGATLGNVQLMDWKRGYLTIAAQCGFNDEFLDFFRCVKAEHGSACARAIRERRPVVVEDVLADWEFAPYRTHALESGFRAVQSTPLISSSGAFVGVLSTHFPAPHRPSEQEMLALKELAKLTASAIILQRAIERGVEKSIANAKGKLVDSGYEAVADSYELIRQADVRLNRWRR